jgi:hypothetical protein
MPAGFFFIFVALRTGMITAKRGNDKPRGETAEPGGATRRLAFHRRDPAYEPRAGDVRAFFLRDPAYERRTGGVRAFFPGERIDLANSPRT